MAPVMVHVGLEQINMDKKSPDREHLGARSTPLSNGLNTCDLFPQFIPTKGPQEVGDPRLIPDSRNWVRAAESVSLGEDGTRDGAVWLWTVFFLLCSPSKEW